MINEDDVKLRAVEAVEQNGIVFLDELDKVCKRSEYGGPDVSREGVYSVIYCPWLKVVRSAPNSA